MTYSEKSVELALSSSVAVFVLTNTEGTDCEFLPLRPRMMTASEMEVLRSRLVERDLCRSLGVIGLVGTSPQCALKEPLEPEQVSALTCAFLAYIQTLLSDSIAAQQDGA